MANGNEGMGGITPYQGPAPAPGNKIDLTDAQPTSVTIDTGDLEPGGANAPNVQSAPSHASTPPPQQPELAAEVAEWKRKGGEALAALGAERAAREAMEAKHAREMQELRINFEIAQAAQQAQPTAPVPHALPGDIRPDDPVTFGQMQAVAVNVETVAKVAAIQATWDLTQQEINQVMSANPALQTLPEPQRTLLIKRSVEQLRANQQPPSVEPAPVAPPQAQPSQQRPVSVVPLVEGSTGSPAFDTPGPTDEGLEANAAYARAKLIPDKKERHKAMKAAWTQALLAKGITHEALSKMSFSASIDD